ncbi:MAG: cobalamin-dependent protein [Deltaproteobacteria bacterium]|jgi:5-methyltetrahydrofolate--homocysteine methyltransferase|nr:cobalamin-dependent protein [Deltaproteobacteria bacterium]
MTKLFPEKTCLVNLVQSLIALEVGASVDIARKLNETEMPPKCILAACEAAMMEINELYDSGEYFIASLIMAGEIMNRVIKLVSPRIEARERGHYKGKVVIGTVRGEIHSLGKNIAGALLTAYGFDVKDLGVDVSVSRYLECVRDWKPDVVGLSVLLSSCFHSLEDTVAALLDQRGAASSPAVFISGAQVTPALKDYWRADYYAATVFDTVRLCESLARSRRRVA